MADNTMTGLDPVTLEILEHKLWQITSEMGMTLRRVSGSPVTLDAKDYATGLMRPDGSLLMVNCGVLFHAVTLPYAVRHLVETYGDQPGIHPGDVYLINDPYICALHAPDMYVLAPIHHRDELVAWAGGMTHLVDIGGIDPGGLSPRAVDAWQEGLRLPGTKLVASGTLRQDVWDAILNLVRDPGMVGLDLNAQMACAHVARERLSELVEEYGLDTYHQLTDVIVDSAETQMRNRLRKLPNGVWRSRAYFDEDGHTDRVYHVSIEMEKRDSTIRFDLSDSSGQAPSFINCGVRGAKAGVFGALAPLIAYDLPWCQGVIDSVDVTAAEGTLVRPRPPAPTSLGTIAAADAVMSATQEAIAKMLMSSSDFQGDFTAMWGCLGGTPVISGLNQEGQYRVQLLMQTNGTGGGARSYADGVNAGGTMYIPEITIPNAETYEADLPLLFLYVRERTDSAGAGKWRGGSGVEAAVTLHDAPSGEALVPFVGRGTRAPLVSGLSGGYPAANWVYAVRRDSDVADVLSRGCVPVDVDEVQGALEQLPGNGVTTLHGGDIFLFAVHGGGGYGDPLDRHETFVASDVRDKHVSRAAARDVYGVVLDDSLRVDKAGTEALRRHKRDTRRADSQPRQAHHASAKPVRSLTEYLRVLEEDGELTLECRKCSYRFGSIWQDYKQQAVVREVSADQAGPAHHLSDPFALREFCCPGCGTKVDVELCVHGAAYVHSFQPRPS